MQHYHNDLRNRDNRRIQGIDDFIALLSQHGCRPRRSASGWVALCPAHELDGQKHNPSLSVRQGHNGRILVHCFANCPTERVVAALGLQLSDLMPPRHSAAVTSNRVAGATAKRDSDNAESSGGKTFATAEEAIAELTKYLRRQPTAVWPYKNARGETIAYAVRFDPPGQGKIIRYVSLREGGWQIAGIPAPRPPFRLPEILSIRERNCLVIVEGEKTADAAVRCGLAATTSAGGAEAASKTNWALLEPATWRRIVILPDNDSAGEKYADDVARLLWAAGARDIRVVRLVDYANELPEGGDLADVIESPDFYGLPLGEGATPSDIGRWILQTAEQAARWEPEITAGYLQWEPYPTDALPSPLAEFVRETAQAIGCDESFVALPLLAQAAAAIGTTRMLKLTSEWQVPSVLWCVIIGESGSLKTAALRAALRWAKQCESKLQEQFERDLEDYHKELDAWKNQAEPDAKRPKPPAAKRFMVQDVTIEALAPILKHNPRGLLLVRDELAAWLRGFDKYAKNAKGAEAPNWNSLYNAETLTVDPKTSGTIHVPLAAVSIAGAIQPGVLKRALTTELRECGLASRLLMTMPPRREKKWPDTNVASFVKDRVSRVLDKLFAIEHCISDEDKHKPRVVSWSDDAEKEYKAFYETHAKRLEDATDDWASALSKLEELPARLALIIHLTRWANGEQVNPDLVDADSMQRAIRLTRWHIHETQRIYQFLDASDGEESQLELLAWLQRRGGYATVRDLYTSGPRVFRHNQAAAETALGELAKQGYGRWETAIGERGGRPTRVFRLAHIETAAPDMGEDRGASDDGRGRDRDTGDDGRSGDGDNGGDDGGDTDSGDGGGGGDDNGSDGSGPLPNTGLATVDADAKPRADEIRRIYENPASDIYENPRGGAWTQNPETSTENRGFASASSTAGQAERIYENPERRIYENPERRIYENPERRIYENQPRIYENPERRIYENPEPVVGRLTEAEQALLAWLRNREGVATVREIRQSLWTMRKPGIAEAALDKLAALGLGRWEPAPAGRRGRVARRFRLTQLTAEPAPGQEAGLTAEPATEATTEDAEPSAEAEPALEPVPELAPLTILDRAMRLPTEWRERFWQLLDAAGRCPLPERALQAYRRLLAELPRELRPILATAPRAEPNRPDNAVIVAMMAKLSPGLQRRFWQLYDRHAGKYPRKELPWIAWQELQREIGESTNPDMP